MSLYKNRLAIKGGTSMLTNEIGQNNLRSFDQFACRLCR